MIRILTGWVALLIVWSAQAQTILFPASSSESIITCTASLYDNGGSSGSYPINSNASLLLTPASPDMYMSLYFGDFNTSSPDVLKVYDGADASAPLLLTLSGDAVEDLIGEYGSIRATNPSGKLFLTFISDGIPDPGVSGFLISIGCTTPEITMENNNTIIEQTCNAYLSGESSYISDFLGELNISAGSSDKTLKISFLEFDIKPFDTLFVYDGSYTDNLIVKYTNNNISPMDIIASNNTRRITLILKAKSSTPASGISSFRAHASCVDPVIPTPTQNMPASGNISLIGCDVLIYDSGGLEGNYSAFENGSITLNPATADKKVKVEFRKMKLGNGTLLSVFNGVNTAAPLVNNYFGTDIPPSITATNSSGAITLKFYSSEYMDEGFEIFASCVIPVSSVNLAPASATLEVGETLQLTESISPSDAGEDLIWASANPSIAVVSSTGLVTAKTTGSTTIIRRTSDWSIVATSSITVSPIAVTGISISPSDATLSEGNSVQLIATILPSDAGNKTVAWISSDPSKATVSSDGMVTGISVGTVTITATTTAGGFTSTATITISPIAVASIVITPSTVSVAEGSSIQLASEILPLNATDQSVTWSSSDELIASVSGMGLVTGVSTGIATLTATTTDGGFTATSSITVSRTNGVNGEVYRTGIIVYPNPASNKIRIENVYPGTHLDIYNQEGMIVASEVLHENKEIDLQTLVNGVYTIKLIVDENDISVQKLVVLK